MALPLSSVKFSVISSTVCKTLVPPKIFWTRSGNATAGRIITLIFNTEKNYDY